MSLQEWIVGVLLVVGAFFFLVSALGLVRFPDVLTRMSAMAKASTLGAVCTLAAYGIAYWELGVEAVALIAIVFLGLTAPVAAHAIARASYRRGHGVPEGAGPDELAGRVGECEEAREAGG